VLSRVSRVTVCIGHGLRQIVNVLLGVLRTQLVFCWFASVYASIATLAASLLGKRSVIVIGGVDMAKEKEFGYGLWLSPWKSTLASSAIKRASRVLVVDQSLKNEVVERVKYSGGNLEILPTGHDSETWKAGGSKEQTVLTVAEVHTEGRLKIKGIDLLFEVARQLPQTKFVLIGYDSKSFPGLVPPKNLQVYPILSQSELLQFYRRAKVYCQPSRREGLSNTLCEAMLCECVPVATDVGGSAQAVGECGIVAPANGSRALVSGIQRALGMPDEVGRKARERVISLFPKEARENRLKELVREMSR